MRRIIDEAISQISDRAAAVDPVIQLPEPAIELKQDLGCRVVVELADYFAFFV